MITICRVN